VASRGSVKRKRLFSLYARNLSIYFPQVTDKFLCPVCLTLFSKDALITNPPDLVLAHLVPQSLKRRDLCTLTCRTCDNNVGTAFDSHVAKEKRFREWEQGATPISGYLKHKSGNVGVEIRRIATAFHFRLLSQQSSPESYGQFLKILEAATSEGSNVNFSFTVPAYSSTRRNISLLYSAFLTMFYYFGYEYVLSPNTDCVRRGIQGNSAFRDWHKAIFPLREARSEVLSPLPTVSIVVEPKDLRSFLVVLPSPKKDEAARCVLLPGFGGDGEDAYNRILNLTRPPGNLNAVLIPNDPSPRLASVEYKWFGHWLWRKFIGQPAHQDGQRGLVNDVT